VREMNYKQISLFDDVNFRQEQFAAQQGKKAPIEQYLG